jgi:hypothetical protein
VVDIPAAPFVYLALDNGLAPPLLQVLPVFPAGKVVLDTAPAAVGPGPDLHTSGREVLGKSCVESCWIWVGIASWCQTAHRTGCHLEAR